jgi:hypothetical protein
MIRRGLKVQMHYNSDQLQRSKCDAVILFITPYFSAVLSQFLDWKESNNVRGEYGRHCNWSGKSLRG